PCLGPELVEGLRNRALYGVRLFGLRERATRTVDAFYKRYPNSFLVIRSRRPLSSTVARFP
ncbi:MAG: hypothetical protein ACLFS4_05655, partial [Opitutales bacterium]